MPVPPTLLAVCSATGSEYPYVIFGQWGSHSSPLHSRELPQEAHRGESEWMRADPWPSDRISVGLGSVGPTVGRVQVKMPGSEWSTRQPGACFALWCLLQTGQCRSHHQLKQHPRWALTQPTPGTFRWTTPAGRSYIVRPDTYPM